MSEKNPYQMNSNWIFFVNQANNAYIFPGFGLGLIMSGTIRMHDGLLLAACKCFRDSNIHFNMMLDWHITTSELWLKFLFNGIAEALASQVTQEHYDRGLIYPPFTNIRKISAHIAAKVATKAYELGEP